MENMEGKTETRKRNDDNSDTRTGERKIGDTIVQCTRNGLRTAEETGQQNRELSTE